MNRFILTTSLILTSGLLFGQANEESYRTLVTRADSFYNAKNFFASASTYSRAIKHYPEKVTKNNLYDAACSWALCNKPDSAFIDLFEAVKKKNYYDAAHISKDADLTTLHNDKRWPQLMGLVERNKVKTEAGFNMPVVKTLDSVFADDQGDRLKISEIETKYGAKSAEMDRLWQDMEEKDSVNLVKVEAILNKYGWLGADAIGEHGNLALFLVIQHADQETQEKYLPVMRKAVTEGKANAADFALLEDRVALEEGKKQIYGSQVHHDPQTGKNSFFPIEDEQNVDKRRADVGLGPLRDYAKQYNFDYQVPKKQNGSE